MVDDSVAYDGAKEEVEDGRRVEGGGGRRGRVVNIVDRVPVTRSGWEMFVSGSY